MALYLISYDVTKKDENDDIYKNIDTAIQRLDKNGKRLLYSQWVIEHHQNARSICDAVVDRLTEEEKRRIKILLVSPMDISSIATYPRNIINPQLLTVRD